MATINFNFVFNAPIVTAGTIKDHAKVAIEAMEAADKFKKVADTEKKWIIKNVFGGATPASKEHVQEFNTLTGMHCAYTPAKDGIKAEFDVEAFMADYPELYKQYVKEVPQNKSASWSMKR